MNEAWRSDDSAVESYIGYIKRHFYKQKLQVGANPLIVDGKNLNPINMREMIEKSLNEYRDFSMKRMIDKCLN